MKQQVNSLTASRAFAAIMVFIFHFGRTVDPFNRVESIFLNGNLAVSYFYVLSGFVLYVSYSNNYRGYRDYIVKRVARVAPAYLLGLGLYMLVYFFIYKASFNAEIVTQLLCNILFIQACIPKYALSLNFTGWSIGVEMFFYLLFPLLLLFQKKSLKWFAISSVVIFAVTQVVFHLFFKNDYGNTWNFCFYQYHPIMHINQFLIGMIGGYWYKNSSFTKPKFSFMPFVLLVIILFCLAFKPVGVFYDAGLFAPLFMLLIVSTAKDDPAFLNFKPLVFLGEISYGIYILQFPVYEFLRTLNDNQLKLSPRSFFFFSLAGLILAATLSYYFVEKPIRDLVVRSRRKQAVQ